MRKILLLMLLASAASPALAGPEDKENRGELRGHRAEKSQSDSDSQRQERPAARPERSYEPPERNEVSRPKPASRQGGGHTFAEPQQRDAVEQRVRKAESNPTLPERPEVERPARVTEQGDSVRNWRRVERDGPNENVTIEDRNLRTAPNTREGRGLVQPRPDTPRVVEPADRRVSRRPLFGTEPPAPSTANTARAHPTRRWDTHWRHDRRYDWNDWRRRHRSRFHFGFYYDPFGWDYFRYGIGWRMWPSYYRNSYWLNDPWYYRLPPAYGPYRWVRYHHDAVLVNIYTGQIADIVYNFFW